MKVKLQGSQKKVRVVVGKAAKLASPHNLRELGPGNSGSGLCRKNRPCKR